MTTSTRPILKQKRIKPQHAFEIFGLVLILTIAAGTLTQVNKIIELFSSSEDASALSQERYEPSEVLRALERAVTACLENAEIERRHSHLFRAKPSFNYRYNLALDRKTFAWKILPRRSSRPEIADCIAERVYAELELEEWRKLDHEIAWLYIYLRQDGEVLFLCWPFLEIPDSFQPRPWEWIDSRHSEMLGTPHNESQNLLQTKPYRDSFTGEHVLTLLKLIGEGDAIVAADLRLPRLAAAHTFYLVINFFVLICFVLINFVSARELEADYIKAWHRGWLCWAGLFAVHSLSYLVRSPSDLFQAVRWVISPLPPLLSLANNGFFLLCALSLLDYADRKRRYLYSLRASLGFFVSWLLTEFAWPDPIARRVPDVLFSVVISIAMGRALTSIILKGRILELRRQRQERKIPPLQEVLVRFGPAAIWAFFVLLSLQQVALLAIPNNITLTSISWLSSVGIKLGFFGLFYVIILVDRFWQETALTHTILSKIAASLITCDKKGRIVHINDPALLKLGLSRQQAEYQPLYDVFFCSIYDVRRMLGDLQASRVTNLENVDTKQFYDWPNRQHRVIKHNLRARRIESSERGRAFAVVEILDVENEDKTKSESTEIMEEYPA